LRSAAVTAVGFSLLEDWDLLNNRYISRSAEQKVKVFVVLLLLGIGGYLLYLSTSVRWANFPPLCVSGVGCLDGYALAGGAVSLVLALLAATRME
jgi:hypothetical protein